MRSAERSISERIWLEMKDRPALIAIGVNQLPYLPDAVRVEPAHRLVQDQQPRRMNEGANEAELLPHPARVVTSQRVTRVPQPERVEQLLHAALGRVDPAKPAEVTHELPAGQR